MDTTALMQSLVLTGAGMLVVFVFMGLLILVVKLFLAIAFRFFPDAEETEPVAGAAGAAKPDEQVAAAIAAALQAGRQKKV